MKSKDIKEISRLFRMKQQAAALKLKNRVAEQGRLYNAATQGLQESFTINNNGVDQPSAADMAAANRYRAHLRAESERLKKAAQSLDEPIDGLREETRHALNRDIVSKTLLADDRKKIRLKVNHRDEEAREQLTRQRHGPSHGASR